MMVADLTSAVWRKARRSGSTGGCVEVAFLADGMVAVRDTKDPDGASLVFTPYEWRCFIDGVRRGEFDLR